VDQRDLRGTPRPQGAACDIGAVERLSHDPTTPSPGPTPGGSNLISLVPARVLETRRGSAATTVDRKLQGIGRIAAGTTLEVPVTGRGGVPATGVGAVMVNATAINPSKHGFATIFPCGSPRPTASSLNYAPGDVTPNAVFAKVGTGGKICIFTLADIDMVIDVNGWTAT
jgi:hypothetical protein